MEFQTIQANLNKRSSKQPIPYFNQLSISSIKGNNINDDSTDFENEKLLFNQINSSITSQQLNQYGLKNPVFTKNFTKKSDEDSKIKLSRGNSGSRLQNFNNCQKNLCFNKQLRRKKNKTQSKQKNVQKSTQISIIKQLQQYQLNRNLKSSTKKTSLQQKPVLAAKSLELNIKKIVRPMEITLKIYEEPLNLLANQLEQNKKRLYSYIPDQFKFQINDYNHNLIIQPLNETNRKSTSKIIQNRRKSSTRNCLKNSFFSKTSEQSDKVCKNSWMLINSQSQKVVQLHKPLNLDCKNQSFYSSTTEQHESPISKDSCSTATHRVIRRNQFINSQPNKQQQYFSAGLKNRKFYK